MFSAPSGSTDVPNDVDEKEILDESQGSILMGIISQLRKGSDLSKVTLPTFVLEPRSMLERITDFMSHPELILATSKKSDPLERFLDVVRYYLSGWHIRPKGVKKPYNPVLGEIFRCTWEYPDKTKGFYVAEQVMHHPPISSYLYCSPENYIEILGEVRPKSKFLGNSAATIMEGGSRIKFLNIPGEEYIATNPNVYARGILFGTMYMEHGDTASVRCPQNDLICEVEFKIKGFFSGTYNGIGGKIKRESTGEILYTLSGKWSEIIFIQEKGSKSQEVYFDVSKHTIYPKIIAPEESQEEFESRRLWSNVSKGLNSRNMDYATQEKTLIENNQRLMVKKRAEAGITWRPRFFEQEESGSWEPNFEITSDKDKTIKTLQDTIFSPPTDEMHAKFWHRD